MEYSYKTKGTCSRKINFAIDGGVIKNIRFEDGCDGNLKALASFADGLTVGQIEEKCKGITCGRRSTSCADQLAKAVREAYEESEK
ncbi:MAG: TIGR03905 family TSCPD domain-containing protein [Clostridiales bacterium]|jgi:uncharacterized protein (TIGR03905 family)|nr:TIGR03905 family TSCPD domain-containing protein [Clostridiales bacterium]